MPLSGCHVLVVEDEHLLAHDLCDELEDAGGVVIGPAGSVKSAQARVAAEPRIDAAVPAPFTASETRLSPR